MGITIEKEFEKRYDVRNRLMAIGRFDNKIKYKQLLKQIVVDILGIVHVKELPTIEESTDLIVSYVQNKEKIVHKNAQKNIP